MFNIYRFVRKKEQQLHNVSKKGIILRIYLYCKNESKRKKQQGKSMSSKNKTRMTTSISKNQKVQKKYDIIWKYGKNKIRG